LRRSLRAALARLVHARSRGTNLVLLFDYDGTLVPIVDRPSMAVLSDETRYRLEQLALMPSIFIGVLSGRAIDDLRDRVGVAGAYYSGTSGLEVSFGRSSIVRPESARAIPLVAAALPRIRHALAGYTGAWVEHKPLGLTVHYRAVTPGRIDALRADVSGGIRSLSGLKVVDSAMAIEITPDLGWTKGSALRAIVSQVGGDAVLPLYAGDEANDTDALTITVQAGGVAIGIGPVAPATAQYLLPDPRALGCCLDALLKMLVATSVAAHRL
jgi:trehalose 6-phosphate phosphatase